MSDAEEKAGLEEGVEPESPSEGAEGAQETPEVDVVALQDRLRRSEEQIANLNKAIHEERGEKKALKEQLAETALPKQEPQEQYETDDLITVGQAKEMFQGEINTLKAEFQKQRDDINTLAMSEQKMKAEHEDYAEVVQDIAPYLSENPAIAQGLMKDPATAAAKLYELGKRFQGKLDKQATAEALANPVNQPKTMGQRSGTTPRNPQMREDMTLDEAAEVLAEAKKRGTNYHKKLIGEL